MSPSSKASRTVRSRNGYSLLEVIVALAILGMSALAISQAMFAGSRSAAMMRDLTTAQLLCDTKVSELCAGAIPLQSASGQPIAEAPGWQYSIVISQSNMVGLLIATVSVVQTNSNHPMEFKIVRFLPDPEYAGTIYPDQSLGASQ